MANTIPKRRFYAEGNKGGSYLFIETVDEETVHIRIGETCVTTIDQKIKVMDLAAILTRAHDIGFDQMLKDYGFSEGGRGTVYQDLQTQPYELTKFEKEVIKNTLIQPTIPKKPKNPRV